MIVLKKSVDLGKTKSLRAAESDKILQSLYTVEVPLDVCLERQKGSWCLGEVAVEDLGHGLAEGHLLV